MKPVAVKALSVRRKTTQAVFVRRKDPEVSFDAGYPPPDPSCIRFASSPRRKAGLMLPLAWLGMGGCIAFGWGLLVGAAAVMWLVCYWLLTDKDDCGRRRRP